MNNDIISPENLVYAKPELMNDTPMHYCAGFSHGVVHKLVAEVIAEMGMEEKAIGVSPVGCAVFAYRYIDIDWQEAPHGRAGSYSPIRATAIWPASERQRPYTRSTAGSISPSFSLIMPSMV